jgi:hypothetical protein
MTTAEQNVREMISNLTLAELLDEWELTSKIDNPEIYTVRGWLMDELESRNPEAFNKWLDQDEPTDEMLKEFMTI